ncbi:MAG: DNA helicase RecQ [Treponema sp.]|nr:DNA helicase RecQ [Treponema sp.]
MKLTVNAFEGAAPNLVLSTVFGYDSFRPLQKEIIESVLKGKDTLAIMPTGGGKSVCYQIPALIFEGITVVVSPLISLMQDQVASLEAAGIHSVYLNSTLEWEDYLQATHEIKTGNVKIIYISPEGLATDRIRNLLSDPFVKVSCITIDESHCISSWGHDFRPDYLEIKYLRKLLPDAVMLALTATATEQVRKDIIKNLGMKNPAVFISSFNRANIYLEVSPKRKALAQVVEYIKKRPGESGIIYCFSRKQVDELTDSLSKMGFSVLNYHAGLTDAVRAKNQDLFIRDEIQIMVATVAFGMGINKSNVRYVINYDLPKSLEEYYQEIGRAGRDGLPSSALLLYSGSDAHKVRYFFNEQADPSKSEILLQGMLKFATTRTCRRKALLSYFGEIYEHPSEEAKDCCCDICTCGDMPLCDVTIPFQKLLSCIYRTNERYGASYVIDILLGSKSKRILENEHNYISTYGIGKELTKEDWFELVEVLVGENYLYKDGEYNVLKMTYMGKSALNNRDTIRLPVTFRTASDSGEFIPAGRAPKKPAFIILGSKEKAAQKPDENDEESQRIITDLKAWRKRKADDLNIPPYAVFNDKTLLDLAAKKPKTKADLMNVFGLGKVKIENYGNGILRVISGD